MAGGLARRMGNQDKGLIEFNGYPMIRYAIDAMEPVVDNIIINANRNRELYEKFGYPVVADLNTNFDGPLSGILASMSHAESELLIVTPCDSPMIKSEHLAKMIQEHCENNADIAVAFDGERLHPVFLVLKTSLIDSLKDYLGAGQRKIDIWLKQHKLVNVDFSKSPDVFLNINTLVELSELERQK